MSVKKLIFSAAASILFLQFVVPLLRTDESIVGAASVLAVGVFCVSAAGLIAEGCSYLINVSRKLPPLRPTVPHEQGATMTSDAPALGQAETPHVEPKPATAARPAVGQERKSKQTKNHVDVLLGKEAVA